MIRFATFLTEAKRTIVYSVGMIDAHGAVESHDFDAEDVRDESFGMSADGRHALSDTHDDQFPGRRLHPAQRFRMSRHTDGTHVILWDDEPSRGDYFTVADHYENMGIPIKRQTFDLGHNINPQNLKETVLAEAKKKIYFSVGIINHDGSILSHEYTEEELMDDEPGHAEAFPNRFAPAAQRFRVRRDKNAKGKYFVDWDAEPDREDFYRVEDYYDRLGMPISYQETYPHRRVTYGFNPLKDFDEAHRPMRFASYLHEAVRRDGFVLASGSEIVAGRNHTDTAARLLKNPDGTIDDLLAQGAIRFSTTRGELCLHYNAGNPTTAQHALTFLQGHYVHGDTIFLDIVTAPYGEAGWEHRKSGRFATMGEAARFIRTTGGLHTEEAKELSDVAFLIQNCSPTDDAEWTSFLLPNGTRLHTSQTHDRAAGYRLTFCLKQGVIRYVVRQGIELAVLPTDTQAEMIAADFFGQPLMVDITPTTAGQHRAYNNFDPAPSASVLRSWIKAHLPSTLTEAKTINAPTALTKRFGTTTVPRNTLFILPTGVRITGEHYENALDHDAASSMIGLTLADVLQQGVIRYRPSMHVGADGGVNCGGRMTEAQARVIADDWNYEYHGTLYVDIGSNHQYTKAFPTPFKPDALRRWVNSMVTESYNPVLTEGVVYYHGTVPGDLNCIKSRAYLTEQRQPLIYSLGQIDHSGAIESKDFRGDYDATPEFREPVTHAIFTRHAPAAQRFRYATRDSGMFQGQHVIWWDAEPSRGDFFAVEDYYTAMGVTVDAHVVYPNRRITAQQLTEGYQSWSSFLTERSQHMRLASANLQSIRYNRATQALTVWFRSGAIYRYDGVPEETVNELKDADSKGQFFFLNIRDAFTWTKLKPSRPHFRHAWNTAKGGLHHFGYIGNTRHSPENR